MGTRILIANLPPDTSADEVREALVSIGAPVLDVTMVPENDPDSNAAVAELDIEWTIAKIMEGNRKIRTFKGRQVRLSVLTEVH